MNWNLHAGGLVLEPGLREHIDRRLTFALSRFDDRLMGASVYLADINGPKGGIDKSCRIVVRLRGAGEAIAEIVDTDWPVAVDRAATRIGHNVGRLLERKREIDHDRMNIE